VRSLIATSEDGIIATGTGDAVTEEQTSAPSVVPGGARNPFNYEVEDGSVGETTVGGNSVADVAPGIGYEDTEVDEAAETSDDPRTTREVIDEYADTGPSNPSGSGGGKDRYDLTITPDEVDRGGLPGGVLLAGLALVGAVVLGGDA